MFIKFMARRACFYYVFLNDFSMNSAWYRLQGWVLRSNLGFCLFSRQNTLAFLKFF